MLTKVTMIDSRECHYHTCRVSTLIDQRKDAALMAEFPRGWFEGREDESGKTFWDFYVPLADLDIGDLPEGVFGTKFVDLDKLEILK